uniref:UPF0057-domain-containing protein n=1 Tax=Globodera pallida TaxID=36090 RepID=A0A183C7K6_GLOPA
MAEQNFNEFNGNEELHEPSPQKPLLENDPIKKMTNKTDQKQLWWLMKCALCVLLPPIGVVFHGIEDKRRQSTDFKYQLLFNVLLTFCGFFPGQLHAAWYCFYKKIE